MGKIGFSRKILLQSDRLGLMMIISSLVVISTITVFLFKYHLDSRLEQIRSQGTSLVRLLASLPNNRMASGEQRSNLLQLIRNSQDNPAFAYAAVVDTIGTLLGEASIPGTIIPFAPVPTEPSAWIGERILDYKVDNRQILEYHSPVFKDGNLEGYIRIGFFKPGFGLTPGQLAFFATLALPIFLLTPLFYFLVKRETKPLKSINQSIDRLLSAGNFQRVEVNATGELLDFTRRFNQFMEITCERLREMEGEQTMLRTSTKLLSYKRKRVESVLHSLPEGILILDESGLVSFSNAKLEHLLGLQNGDLAGKDVNEWPGNREVVDFLMKYQHSDGRSFNYSADTLQVNPDNAPDYTLLIIAYPLISPKGDGEIMGTLIIFRDISEEALAKKGRGEFIAQIAHEIKTPLNVLAMYSEALMGEEGNSEHFRIEALNVISDEVERMSTLINNLLSLTKIDNGNIGLQRQRVKIRDLLQDAFDTVMRASKNKDLDFVLELPKEMSSVNIDKELVRVAINNLLTNAIKYNKPGGTVTLKAEETSDQILVSVTDTGIGVDAADKERIFDKFYRSNNDDVRKRTGHGLGLSLAREITLLHHGDISVSSTPGVGTEFVMTLENETYVMDKVI